MLNTRKARSTMALITAAAVVVSCFVVPGFVMVFLGLFAIAGIVVSAAFLYDWVLQGDEDLEAARRQQNAEHARDLSNDVH